ncbi:MAG TPA: hypothetical protein VKA04_08205 [Pseudodesulfovibrio sp.]|nr:hypothetical protein [Pseudodesulfovibrio sp.]
MAAQVRERRHASPHCGQPAGSAPGQSGDITSLDGRIAKLTALLADAEALKTNDLKTGRTFQISDHLPLWGKLPTDFSGEYLTRLRSMTGTQSRDNASIPM